MPLLILFAALDIYCLIDLARAQSVRHAPKLAWVIVILVVSAPVGALLYLFAGKDRGRPGPGDAAAPARHEAPAQRAGAPEPATRPSPRAGRARSGRGRGGGPPIVSTAGLTRDYGGTGLFDVALAVPRGSIYGLVGPNGAGKTTLLSILSGTRRPGQGTVSLDIGRSRIAVCPDVPEFDGWLTAYEVVDLARC